ncbi:hypothetical protein PAMC26577_36110 [Caballeronia sordidicola]|uniref:Uncharacterized protein n=1 Tax=Caballeronia sordidicola TaxID=196367 RepID=A0A242M8W7_CABSO|nr:hypothetical protein PAMC26577_36110 [Caballeronia sordidicola]
MKTGNGDEGSDRCKYGEGAFHRNPSKLSWQCGGQCRWQCKNKKGVVL